MSDAPPRMQNAACSGCVFSVAGIGGYAEALLPGEEQYNRLAFRPAHDRIHFIRMEDDFVVVDACVSVGSFSAERKRFCTERQTLYACFKGSPSGRKDSLQTESPGDLSTIPGGWFRQGVL